MNPGVPTKAQLQRHRVIARMAGPYSGDTIYRMCGTGKMLVTLLSGKAQDESYVLVNRKGKVERTCTLQPAPVVLDRAEVWTAAEWANGTNRYIGEWSNATDARKWVLGVLDFEAVAA